MSTIMMQKFAERVKKASDGRLVIKVLSGGAIVPASKEWDGLTDGVLDMAGCNPAYNKDKYPSAALFSCRVGGMDPIAMRVWFDFGGGIELMEKMVEGTNIKVFRGPAAMPPEVFAVSTVPITTLADIKGLKFRTMGDGGVVLDQMGASTVFFPSGELYESLQRGVVDAGESSCTINNMALSLQEVCKYWVYSNTRSPTDHIPYLANIDSWNKLTPDLQQIVEDAIATSSFELYEELMSAESAAVEDVINYGCEVSHLPLDIESEFLRLAKKFYDEEATKGAFYAEVLESQRSFQKSWETTQALTAPLASK